MPSVCRPWSISSLWALAGGASTEEPASHAWHDPREPRGWAGSLPNDQLRQVLVERSRPSFKGLDMPDSPTGGIVEPGAGFNQVPLDDDAVLVTGWQLDWGLGVFVLGGLADVLEGTLGQCENTDPWPVPRSCVAPPGRCGPGSRPFHVPGLFVACQPQHPVFLVHIGFAHLQRTSLVPIYAEAQRVV